MPRSTFEPVGEVPGLRLRLGESPRWQPAAGWLFADVAVGRVYRLPASGDAPVLIGDLDRRLGCVLPVGGDSWVAAAGHDLVYPDGRRWIRFAGLDPAVRLNDGTVSPDGDVIIGAASGRLDDEQGCLLVHRVATGRQEVALTGLGMPNGMGWSPDARTLYLADSARRHVLALPYRDGRLGAPRVVATFRPGWLPDGLAVDADGHLNVALWGGGRISRHTADGRHLGEVTLPPALVTSCAFGGPSGTEVLATTAREDDTSSGGEIHRIAATVSGATTYILDPQRLAQAGEAR